MIEAYIKRIRIALSNAENRGLFKNIIGNYAIKGGAMIVSLFITPAYIRYFYSQKLLGMWFTATAVLNWLMMFDFGIGGGVRNQLVAPLEKENKEEIKEILSAGFISVGVVVIALIAVLCVAIEFVDLHALFGVTVDEISTKVLSQAVLILAIGVCIRFFSSLISHVLYAMQQATLPSLMILISNTLVLVYLYVAKPSGNESDIINLAWINSFANNLPALVVLVVLFNGRLKGAVPSIRAFRMKRALEIMGFGGQLFFLQCLLAFVFGAKELLITWFVGAEQVVDYQIYYKLIGTIGGLFALALTPVWSAVTKAKVSKQNLWLKNLYKTGRRILVLFGGAQFILLALMPWIAKIWIGNDLIHISYKNGAWFCVYNLLYMWIMLNYNFACGLGRIKLITICLAVAFFLNIALAMWWCSAYSSWVTVVVATAVAAIPAAILVPIDIMKSIQAE